jgi:hypothetical protein
MIDRLPTVEDVARMRRDGYLVVRNFVSPHQLAELLQWTAQLEGAPEVSGRHWVYREDSMTTPGRRPAHSRRCGLDWPASSKEPCYVSAAHSGGPPRAGSDPDDALYLMGPLAWLGWLSPILVGASVGATAVMIITGVRLQRQRSQSPSSL